MICKVSTHYNAPAVGDIVLTDTILPHTIGVVRITTSKACVEILEMEDGTIHVRVPVGSDQLVVAPKSKSCIALTVQKS